MFRTNRSKSSQSNLKERGFSVVELAVVLLVIAIIAAIVVPLVINWMKRYRVGIAAQNVATAVQRARYLATSDNTRAGVFVKEAHRLEIETFDPEDLNKPTKNRGTVLLPDGTAVSSDAPREIAFDGRGVVDPLPNESPVFRVNGADGYYALVTISPTGQVTIGEAMQSGA
jgi:prepilin-type N-terminal cleavage/methylation domain-containing protein